MLYHYTTGLYRAKANLNIIISSLYIHNKFVNLLEDLIPDLSHFTARLRPCVFDEIEFHIRMMIICVRATIS